MGGGMWVGVGQGVGVSVGVLVGRGVRVGWGVGLEVGVQIGGGVLVGWGDAVGAGPEVRADGRYVRERVTIIAIAPRTIALASTRTATMSHFFRDIRTLPTL